MLKLEIVEKIGEEAAEFREKLRRLEPEDVVTLQQAAALHRIAALPHKPVTLNQTFVTGQ